jgi:hypothetical protein
MLYPNTTIEVAQLGCSHRPLFFTAALAWTKYPEENKAWATNAKV